MLELFCFCMEDHGIRECGPISCQSIKRCQDFFLRPASTNCVESDIARGRYLRRALDIPPLSKGV